MRLKKVIKLVDKKALKLRNCVYCILQEHKWKKGKYISHVTAYAVSNAGDTILSKCVRAVFEKRIQINKWNLISVSETVDTKMIQRINKGKALIIGGGGLFLPDTNSNDISGWQWAISKSQIKEIKVPIFIFSVGYNYFKGQVPSDLFIENIKEMVANADFIGLRNTGSVNKVKSLIGKELEEKILFQPCITTIIRKICALPEKKKTGIVAINIAFDREKLRYGVNESEILNNIAKAIALIAERGYTIWYIMHCKSDCKFLPYLRKEKIKFVKKNMVYNLSNKLIDVYHKADIVIGMRGHAQMIPFGVGSRILTLGTHDKMRWFLEDINSLDCYIDLNQNIQKLEETIVDKFIEINEKRFTEIDQRFIEQQDKLWKITRENMRKITQFICDK